MKPTTTPPREIRAAAANLLRPYWPTVDGDTLLAALRTYREPVAPAPAIPTTPRGLTRRQAAAALSISTRCLTNWVRAGKVRVVRLTRRAVRVPESEITRLLTLLPEPPPAAAVPVHTAPPATIAATTTSGEGAR